MSANLDPIVAKKLKHFGRRRLRMIIARGIFAGVVTFLLCMALVAAADWYWLLTDNTRWLLSGAAYGCVALVVWMTSLKKLTHLPAKEEIAKQVELSEPELRENLLSAVELATDDPDSVHDSPVFRGLLQGKVARMMGKIKVPHLLPLRLIARWGFAALVVAGVAAVLLTSSDPRFRQLATRAMLPGANVARVSRIHVEVLKPTPHSLTLAEDETVAVVVEVTGGSVDEVTLETFTEKLGSARQTMRAKELAQWAANIHVQEESVEYRILAGDAITQRFRIESRPRPRVTAFHKTYTYPEYAKLPVETVRETHGDLLILEGTQTELLLELDQDVAEAELRIDPESSDELISIPLTRATTDDTASVATGDGTYLWKATVPVDEAAIYKVHLVAKETGFENIFSPKYEIRPQPDLIPRAGFVDQTESTLLLPPNDILALKAMAEDDLPLETLEQHISVNGEEWQAVPLKAEPSDGDAGRRISAAWAWDLLAHQLKVGDQVTTKLVATDRKGNTGDSIPLRIIVAAADFDPDRHAVMQRKLSLYDHLADFSDLLQEHKASALEIIERLRKPDQTAEQKQLDQTAILDLAAKQREQAGQVLEEIRKVERDMPPGADAYDLDLTGRVIARLQREHANVPAWLVRAMNSTDDVKQISNDLNLLKSTFERTADDAKNVAIHYQHLTSHNFLNAVASDLDALLRQQKLVVESPTQTWQRLLRQETVIINQLRILESTILNQEKRLPSAITGHMNSLVSWVASHRGRISAGTESEEKLAVLKQASQNFYRELQQKQKYDAVDGGLPGRLVGARRDFQNRAGSLYVPISELARATQQENAITSKASDSDDSEQGKEMFRQAERFIAEVDLKHRPSVDQLRSRRELTQTRRDSDNQYASDAGLTHRAVTSQLNKHRTVAPQDSEIPASFLEIAPAYRTLEAGHNLIIARDSLSVLLNMERWESQSLRAQLDHPRQWDVVTQGFELASQRLREAKVANELVAKLDQVRWSEPVRVAGKRITERRWKRDRVVGAGHEMLEIRDELAQVVTEMQPVMAEARAIIAKYAPTIPEMAKQAAEQIRELEKETTEAADALEKEETPEAEHQVAELQEKQEAINEQLADLVEALVEDANAQDVLDKDELERARDADDSVALIKEPAAEMNKAMQEAQATEQVAEQAKELSEAAEEQEKTAQALETVAEHFERLDEGLDVAESRAELRQVEEQQGVAQEMNEQFDNAQQLAQMAQQDANQLMKELEEELARNPAMQQALSEISQNALEDARNALEEAAQNEDNLQAQNENSDQEFLQKKRELAEDLREMAKEAQKLNQVIAQANSSAAQGKTPKAQQKFSETQQKLNQAAAKANTARENQPLEQLAEAAKEAQAAIEEASEALNQAKQETNTGKDEKIHADEKARQQQKANSEKQREQFQDAQKRNAAAEVKNAEAEKRNADKQVKNAERQAQSIQRAIDQAKKQLARKPDDAGLKNNVARQEARKEAEDQKVQAAKENQAEAEQNVNEIKQKADELNKKQMPPLNAPNPATELADQYAQEAMKAAEQLQKQAQELVAETDFGDELAPAQNQLASAEQQQQNITQDVQQAAEDVARAARHERRLKNEAAAEPLRQAAENIQQAADNEATNAEQQLQEAVGEAQQNAEQAAAADQNQSQDGMSAGQQNAKGNQPQNGEPKPNNGQAQEAQQALAAAEAALGQQAEELSSVVEPMLAAAEAQAAAEAGFPTDQPQDGEPTGQPQDGEQPGQPAAGQPQSGQPQSGQPQGGEPQSGQPQPGSQPGAPPTPEEIARGTQLARTLDELDQRQQAAQALAAAEPGEDGQPAESAQMSQAQLDALAQAAQAQQAAASQQRAQAQQQAMAALSMNASESSDNPSDTGPMEDFNVVLINRSEDAEWGKLRNKSAEDLTRGKAQSVSEEYRKSVETYFRVIAERSRKKK